MKKVIYTELAGITISIAGAIYCGINISTFNGPLPKTAAIISLLLLIVHPVVSAIGIWRFCRIEGIFTNYISPEKFAAAKIRFYKLIKFNFYLSHFLIVAILILLFRDKNVFHSLPFCILTFLLVSLFLIYFSRWVLKLYNKAIEQSEELLKKHLSN